MYTYLEDIKQVKIRHNFPYNLIGKIKDIEHVTTGNPYYYKFTIYNDMKPDGYNCVINERHFNTGKYTNGSTVVIEYAELKSFMDIGHCLLIRRIEKPAFNLTGNKYDDMLLLLGEVKRISDTVDVCDSFRSVLNKHYLKYRKAILESKRL